MTSSQPVRDSPVARRGYSPPPMLRYWILDTGYWFLLAQRHWLQSIGTRRCIQLLPSAQLLIAMPSDPLSRANSLHEDHVSEVVSKSPVTRNGVHGMQKQCNGNSVQCTESRTSSSQRSSDQMEETPLHIALICYFSYAVLILFGHLRDLMRRTGIERNQFAQEKDRQVRSGSCSA